MGLLGSFLCIIGIVLVAAGAVGYVWDYTAWGIAGMAVGVLAFLYGAAFLAISAILGRITNMLKKGPLTLMHMFPIIIRMLPFIKLFVNIHLEGNGLFRIQILGMKFEASYDLGRPKAEPAGVEQAATPQHNAGLTGL